MKSFIFSIFFLVVTGCASPGSVKINDLKLSLVDLQKVVEVALPLGKRLQTQNGRGFFSEYFITKQGDYQPAAQLPTRSFAEVFILGDRRPYAIHVRVIVESRDGSGQYQLSRYDKGHARVISRRIEQALHKRREDRNIIDDFRVF